MYMPLVKGTRDKENKETDPTAIMLYSLKKDQKTKAQLKKNYEIIPTPCPPTHTIL